MGPGPTGPDSQKLLYGEVKALELTERVASHTRAGGLDKVSKAEYKEMLEAKAAAEKAAIQAAVAETAANAITSAQPVVTSPVSAEDLQKAIKEATDAKNKAEELAQQFQQKNAELDLKLAAKATPAPDAETQTGAQAQPAETDPKKITPKNIQPKDQ